MESALHILFITFKWIDAFDIILVAFLLYQLYYIVRGTPAISIFIGIFSIYVVWIVVRAFDMKLFGSILSKFIDVGVIAIIVVFQQEIRRFLLFIGTNEFLNKSTLLKPFFKMSQALKKDAFAEVDFGPIVRACVRMGQSSTGALIVLARKSDLQFYVNTGEPLDSVVTERMIENIFFKNSPLHDGAVIISGNRILAARCVLPVTDKGQFPANFGMRHRAAAGITETTDAIAIVVSEQTGNISISANGEIKSDLKEERIKEILSKEFSSLS